MPFNLEDSTISRKFLSEMSLQSLLGFASLFGNQNALEVIEDIGKNHLSQRIRMSALLSLVKREMNPVNQELMIENYMSKEKSKFVKFWLKDFQKQVAALPTKADVKYIIDLSKKFKSHFVKINSPFFSIKKRSILIL